jgi:predicted mannosyl-3-phosphoglycerate phosphatase (HAD superfamily)
MVFCTIDDLIPISGKPLLGFPEFLDSLADSAIPVVWVTGRNRHQLDASLRRWATAPFIAERGSGVYLPEDYFHLKPARTIRLGRFTCIPVAAPQPTASESLAQLGEETGISVVPLRSLSAHELVQNTNLSRRDAESLCQRDFDELFFFAGTPDAEIRRFQQEAARQKFSVRQQGSFWSLAVSASLSTCVRELRKLYDRALRTRAFAVALATASEGTELITACDRAILLTDRSAPEAPAQPNRPTPKTLPLFSPQTWSSALEAIQTRQF